MPEQKTNDFKKDDDRLKIEAEYNKMEEGKLQEELARLNGETFWEMIKNAWNASLGQIWNLAKMAILTVILGRDAVKERLSTAEKKAKLEEIDKKLRIAVLKEKLGINDPKKEQAAHAQENDKTNDGQTKEAPSAEHTTPSNTIDEPNHDGVGKDGPGSPAVKANHRWMDCLTEETAQQYKGKNMLNYILREGKMPEDFQSALISYLYEVSGRMDKGPGDFEIETQPAPGGKGEDHIVLSIPFGTKENGTHQIDLTSFVNGQSDQNLSPEQQMFGLESIRFIKLYADKLERNYGIKVDDGIRRSNREKKDKDGNVILQGTISRRVEAVKEATLGGKADTIKPIRFCDYDAYISYQGQNEKGLDVYTIRIDGKAPGETEKTVRLTEQKIVDDPGDAKNVGDKVAGIMNKFYQAQIIGGHAHERETAIYALSHALREKDLNELLAEEKPTMPKEDVFAIYGKDTELSSKLEELQKKLEPEKDTADTKTTEEPAETREDDVENPADKSAEEIPELPAEEIGETPADGISLTYDDMVNDALGNLDEKVATALLEEEASLEEKPAEDIDHSH